jgi:hypothetical protein
MAWATWGDVLGTGAQAVPAPCCKRVVAGDMLVDTVHLHPDDVAAALTRFPSWQGRLPLYICDGCRSTLTREQVARFGDWTL